MDIGFAVIGIRSKRDDLVKELRVLGLETHSFGVNGALANEADLLYNKSASTQIMRRDLSRGELGCARSHMMGYHETVDKYDWVVFLEDDIQLFQPCIETLKRTLFWTVKPTVVYFDETYKEPQIKFPWYVRPYRTHFYAINNAALRIAASSQTEVLSAADWPIQWAYQVQFILAESQFARLCENVSLIEVERVPLQKLASEHYSSKMDGLLFSALRKYKKINFLFKAIYAFSRLKSVYVALPKNISFYIRIKSSLAHIFSELGIHSNNNFSKYC